MLKELFSHGFVVSSLSKKTADRMLEIIENQNFLSIQGADVYQQHREFKDRHLSFPEIWSNQGRAVQAFDDWDYPQELKDIWQDLKFKYLSGFEGLVGNFDHTCMLAHRFSEGQQIGYHSDTIEATFFGLIAYLGDSDFTENDGGYLRLGRASLDSQGKILTGSSLQKWLNADGNIIEFGKVFPNHGTLVILSNIDPTFVHAVEPLRTQKRRFTHACRFGFANQRFAVKSADRGGYS
jgi:hypothetical protein